ncbi:type II and III secretion system protein family protein [Sphingomonas sp.]|jgi:pilus assembly protein CpaC|uniref:type II and III secretion system protein family protein n=1 Tax=Sphingomonas sp. TaxID=28214 RepID=UPI0035C83D19
MPISSNLTLRSLTVALAAAAVASVPGAAPAQLATTGAAAAASTGTAAPTLQVSTNRGRLVTLSRPMSDLFLANPDIADVQVRSPTQLYVFGKKPGETTLSATARGGAVVYTATIRVGNNYDSIQQMLALALPEAQIAATPMNGLVLLTGTVSGPQDGAEAERLVQAFVGADTKVLSRLRTATPLQVNLQVKFAEVSRTFLKNIGSNLLTRDQTGGFRFGVASGGTPGTITGTGSGTSYTFNKNENTRTSIGAAGRLFGLDILSAIDLGETMGQVTTLANPNLTALSGETGTFLAGGEIPIPISQALGTTSIEYKQFGVSLAYTPTVLSDGRISLRVRPEVSQLDYANAVAIGNGRVPALTTRRAETTVELGSGQSFMIAGLMQNTHNNSYDKTPGLADVPVLGALFKSNAFQRNETELVIVITPYLVRPVNGNDIRLPTDGYRAPGDLERVLVGTLDAGSRGAPRPKPTMQVQQPNAAPTIGALAPVPMTSVTPAPAPVAPAPAPVAPPADRKASRHDDRKGGAPAPGFSIQ